MNLRDFSLLFRCMIVKTSGRFCMEYYGTLGSACGSVETLKEMLAAGMTGVRLNPIPWGIWRKMDSGSVMVQEAGREPFPGTDPLGISGPGAASGKV